MSALSAVIFEVFILLGTRPLFPVCFRSFRFHSAYFPGDLLDFKYLTYQHRFCRCIRNIYVRFENFSSGAFWNLDTSIVDG